MNIASLQSSPSVETECHFEDSSRIETSLSSFWKNNTTINLPKDSSLVANLHHTRNNSENVRRLIPHLDLSNILQRDNLPIIPKNKEEDADSESSLSNHDFIYQQKSLNKPSSNLNISDDNVDCFQNNFHPFKNKPNVNSKERQKFQRRGMLNNSFSCLELDGKQINSHLLQKLKELELQNLNLLQHNDFLSDKLNRLEDEYEQIKSYLDMNLEKCGELFLKVQNEDENKENMARHAKRLDDSLKTINKNYILLQKKVAGLEKENRELSANLKICEAEKKSVSEKWQKLSKKTRLENNYTSIIKNFENEIAKYQKETQEFKEKYIFKDSQFRALKEEEKNYKVLLENSIKIMQNLQVQQENELKEKTHLIDKNQELIQRIEHLKTEKQNDTHQEDMKSRKCLSIEAANLRKENDNSVNLSPNSLQISFLQKENEELRQSQILLQEKLNSANKKWQLVVNEYNKTQTDYQTLLKEKQKEAQDATHLSTSATYKSLDQAEIEDSTFNKLMDEIAKVKPLNENLYNRITHYLNNCLQNSKDSPSLKVGQFFSIRQSCSIDSSQTRDKTLKEEQFNLKEVIQVTKGPKQMTSLGKNMKKPSEIHHHTEEEFVEKVNENHPKENSSKATNQFLQRIISKGIDKRNTSFDNKRRCSGDSLKENQTPNNVSREELLRDKENASKFSQVNLSGSYSDLKKQFINSRILRSLSNEGVKKREKKYQNILNATIDLSTSGNFESGSLLNMSLSNISKTNQNTKRNSIGERNKYLGNQSYFGLYLSKKTQKPENTSIVNSSLNFLSNI